MKNFIWTAQFVKSSASSAHIWPKSIKYKAQIYRKPSFISFNVQGDICFT